MALLINLSSREEYTLKEANNVNLIANYFKLKALLYFKPY
jgi:hypothetical protein